MQSATGTDNSKYLGYILVSNNYENSIDLFCFASPYRLRLPHKYTMWTLCYWKNTVSFLISVSQIGLNSYQTTLPAKMTYTRYVYLEACCLNQRNNI